MSLSYAVFCATLARLGISLEWADDQYLVTLSNIMGEYAKLGNKPERKKVGSANIGKFIA